MPSLFRATDSNVQRPHCMLERVNFPVLLSSESRRESSGPVPFRVYVLISSFRPSGAMVLASCSAGADTSTVMPVRFFLIPSLHPAAMKQHSSAHMTANVISPVRFIVDSPLE